MENSAPVPATSPMGHAMYAAAVTRYVKLFQQDSLRFYATVSLIFPSGGLSHNLLHLPGLFD